MFWQITSFPGCTHHIFLSHCACDRRDLVYPVYDELVQRGIIPWLDRHHYKYGPDSRAALRNGLLQSRHVVFFITLGMMDYRRGWCSMELAYSDLLRANLSCPGGAPLNFELPLFFLDRNDPDLTRTAWNVLRDRGTFHHPANGDCVTWAVNEIVSFLYEQQRLALEMARVLIPGQPVYQDLAARNIPGLIERFTRFDPAAIP